MPTKKAVKKQQTTRRRSTGSKGRRRSDGSAYIVFISYSSTERWIASQMRKEIEGLGVEVQIDQKDIGGGDILPIRIIELITACHEAIVLVSKASARSQWVAFEIGALRAQNKRVTPILNSVSAEAMGPMRDVVAIDLNDFDRFLTELTGRIS